MTRFEHALVVGGTGMLAQAAVGLAAMSRRTTALARREQGLRRVADGAAAKGGEVHPVALDYRDDAALAESLAGAVAAGGPIDVALCWIHGVAPAAPVTVARSVGAPGRPAAYFHVLPHDASASPQRASARRERIGAAGSLTYHEILLGAVREGARTRWLTHEEISGGALAAIEACRDRYVIGDAAGATW